jgi:ketosteroid isomerase-like protein
MSATTRAIVEQLHEAYRNGDGERVAAFIHNDIDWCIYGPARIFPFEGPRHGKAQVLEVLTAIGSQFELKRYEPEIIIVEGDRAATMVRTAFEQRTTGRTLSLRLVNLLRIQDGQVIEFKEFSDTFDVVEQAMGAWLQVPAIAV